MGVGIDDGVAYWKLKNSWGPAFGEGGYFRFLVGNACMRGICKAYIGEPPAGRSRHAGRARAAACCNTTRASAVQ